MSASGDDGDGGDVSASAEGGGDDGTATAGDDGGATGGDGGGNACEDAEATYDDSCQVCGATSCCDLYEACLEDPTCACWFECIGSVYDQNECILECGASMPTGQLLGCMASTCNDECVHWDSPSNPDLLPQ